jgi:hypothetical protein
MLELAPRRDWRVAALLPKADGGSYDIRVELLAGDGTPLAQSETRLKVSYGVESLGPSADASEITMFPDSFAPPPQDEDSGPCGGRQADAGLAVLHVDEGGLGELGYDLICLELSPLRLLLDEFGYGLRYDSI